jgi:hypothetical protein
VQAAHSAESALNTGGARGVEINMPEHQQAVAKHLGSRGSVTRTLPSGAVGTQNRTVASGGFMAKAALLMKLAKMSDEDILKLADTGTLTVGAGGRVLRTLARDAKASPIAQEVARSLGKPLSTARAGSTEVLRAGRAPATATTRMVARPGGIAGAVPHPAGPVPAAPVASMATGSGVHQMPTAPAAPTSGLRAQLDALKTQRAAAAAPAENPAAVRAKLDAIKAKRTATQAQQGVRTGPFNATAEMGRHAPGSPAYNALALLG